MNENRTLIWSDYLKAGGSNNKKVSPMFLGYTRYSEAQDIIKSMYRLHEDFSKFHVLDYGCGVGDYGIFLLRAGFAKATFYDFPRSTNFVEFRLKREGLEKRGITWSVDDKPLTDFKPYDMVIFGEVLEHLEDPAETLALAIASQVKYIFTSSYPYRTEDPEDRYWSNHDHSEKARLLIPTCKKMLEENYTYIKFEGELRLWQRKK